MNNQNQKQMYLNSVKKFHDTVEITTPSKPKLLIKERADLRISLLEEELEELEVAINNGDMVEILDAFCDLQYVLSGAILEFGMKEIFDEAFNEVHRSNMSKFLKLTDDARESVNRYSDNDIEAFYRKVGDQFVIKRAIDNKILKGMHFRKPDLKQFLISK